MGFARLRLAARKLAGDVAAELSPLERELRHRPIGALAGDRDGVAARGHAEHASARGRVPAWNTTTSGSPAAESSPEIRRPVTTARGYPSEASTTQTAQPLF